MRCFHHNDLDGRCAASLVKMFFPDCECREVSYMEEFPVDEIKPGEDVFIVDYSPGTPEEFEAVVEKAGQDRVVWIDHHGSSLEKHKKMGRILDGLRSDTKPSGAMLTWRYLAKRFGEKKAPPGVVVLVDSWDTWTHKDNPLVLNFVEGMHTVDQSPWSNAWQRLLKRDAKFQRDVQKKGKVIREYQENNNREALEKFGFETDLGGYKCLACNTTFGSSKFFDSVKEKYDIFIVFVSDGDQYKVSLYSETVPVDKIAKVYGGGGHPAASGFTCKKLPFKKLPDKSDKTK